MSYAADSHSREARSNRARAGAFTRRAESEARKAEEWYRDAARELRIAAELTAEPQRCHGNFNPASLEARARSFARLGDSYLRASFHSTKYAAFYRHLGARYAEMAVRCV